MNSSGNWFADLFGSPYPGNAPHITSSCPYSECPPINYAWDVSPYDNTIPMYDRVTNNIMGNQGNSRNYLSPSQIGRAHRAYYLTSVRQFIIDDCYNVNSPIIISSDETWDFNIRVYEDIIIENNAQCDITCHVELPYNAKIIVRNGSTLVVDGSITGVNGEAWRGQIDVEPGGELIIEDDGQIFLGEGGSILIDKSSTDIATLSYNLGGEIILSHNTSTLEIIGNLQIGTNAQFTFSGNGFVKFSNPGVDATYNITAGTGASILFSGTGQSDKVLEVQQNTVHFPQLSSLTFENCKIEMGTSKRMQTDAPYPVTFDNVKVTSSTGTNNSHRSFLFSGQSNVTINGSVFEYGQYGIYGNLTWTNGAPLYITNSTFRYNTQGINIYGKGLHLNNCSVINNTSYGVYCDAMSMTSEFIDCNINYNNYGIYYQGSATAHIDIENTYLQSNTVDGVKTNGGFDLNMECAFVNDNNIGVNVANGTIVKPYTCDLSGNYKTIYLNYGSVVLLDQYNQLQADNNYYALHGYVPVKVPSITATHNRWSSVANQSPVGGTHYSLTKYPVSIPSVAVTVTDVTPSYLSCIQMNMGSPLPITQSIEMLSENEEQFENDLPNVVIDGESYPVDLAIIELENLSFLVNSESDYISIINKYIDLVLSCNNYDNSEMQYWQSIANGKLHSILSDFQTFVNFDKSNTSFLIGIGNVIEMNKTVIENPNIPYTFNVEYNLDIALLYRMLGQYEDAIEKLESISIGLTNDQNVPELAFVEQWLCKIQAEKSAYEGLISFDEFMLAIQDCETNSFTKSTGNDNESDQNPKGRIDNESTTHVAFEIVPNPNQGSFTIKLKNPCNSCEVNIINSIGQTVKRITQIEQGSTEVNVTGLKNGHYKVMVLQDSKIIDSQTVIVE
jgi:hypothetical protein